MSAESIAKRLDDVDRELAEDWPGRKFPPGEAGCELAEHAPEDLRLLLAVVDAAKESLKFGEHDGPCDDMAEWDGCGLHLAASKNRSAKLQRTLDALEAAP